ncbi:MAG TPA: RsmB/NOP family class I SAM-dependent RNA methyltransferase, partial [Bacteroidia bacterium]
WSEFRDIQKMPLTKKLEQAKQFPEILHSYGDELYQRASKQLGDKWLDIAAAMNTPANLILRVNTLKNSKEELIKLLAKEGIEVTESAVAPWALICKQRSNVFQTTLFKEGRFEVQDAGSQLIAEYCNAEPGKFVIDACAGAGGKSLYLAAKMKNKGRIIAMDVEAYKLQELKRRASRAGVHNIQMEVIEGQKSIKKHNNQADILLLDVPCSGSGVLKRNPDAKYKITNSFIYELTEKQKFILQNYSQMLKNGGSLVYATCSILPEENEGQIRNFLNNNGGFELEEERTIYPNEMGFDGFYMARIQKKG